MPASQLYEYAVIRLVPRVEREEFLNVGIILYCKAAGFLQTRYQLTPEKLAAFSATCNYTDVQDNLQAFARICHGEPGSGPIGALSLSERFYWLTAIRSTLVQTSRVHPGFTADAEKTLQHLFDTLVK